MPKRSHHSAGLCDGARRRLRDRCAVRCASCRLLRETCAYPDVRMRAWWRTHARSSSSRKPPQTLCNTRARAVEQRRRKRRRKTQEGATVSRASELISGLASLCRGRAHRLGTRFGSSLKSLGSSRYAASANGRCSTQSKTKSGCSTSGCGLTRFAAVWPIRLIAAVNSCLRCFSLSVVGTQGGRKTVCVCPMTNHECTPLARSDRRCACRSLF